LTDCLIAGFGVDEVYSRCLEQLQVLRNGEREGERFQHIMRADVISEAVLL
jgi:hypothetical protein